MTELEGWMRLGLRRAGAALAAVAVAGFGLAGAALAAEPHPWGLNLQPGATPVKHAIGDLHDLLLVIITVITLFVLALLIYVGLRFRASRNPVPSRTTHNTLVEVVWTVVPVIILVVIAVPSFRLLYFSDRAADAEMTINVTGHQWYWSYEYPDHGDIVFESIMIPDDALQPGQPRLLSVDNPLVVPVDTPIRVLVTGVDVLHSWFIPSFGVQMYTVPGRVNETWFEVEEEGTYYGQCNQICGVNHAFMPIEVRAVSREAFDLWVEQTQAGLGLGVPRSVAALAAE